MTKDEAFEDYCRVDFPTKASIPDTVRFDFYAGWDAREPEIEALRKENENLRARIEDAYSLAMTILQSNVYRDDLEARGLVDKVITPYVAEARASDALDSTGKTEGDSEPR